METDSDQAGKTRGPVAWTIGPTGWDGRRWKPVWQGARLPCGRILPAGGFIRYPRVRIRMEKSIAVSVYGGFSRDRLPETG